MTRKLIATILLAAGLALAGCGRQQALFNGRSLDGWKPQLADNSVDPATVWSVKDGVLHCKGKPNGYVRTTQEYSNYKLHLEWRWPETSGNSGVLLHATGPDKVWPQCMEAQLKNNNAGDLVTLGQGVKITVEGKEYQTSPGQTGLVIGKQHQSSENPAGQWNIYEILCSEDTVRLYVNGVLQNTGTDASLKRGFIGLQSEGAPIEFRNIYLEPLP